MPCIDDLLVFLVTTIIPKLQTARVGSGDGPHQSHSVFHHCPLEIPKDRTGMRVQYFTSHPPWLTAFTVGELQLMGFCISHGTAVFFLRIKC